MRILPLFVGILNLERHEGHSTIIYLKAFSIFSGLKPTMVSSPIRKVGTPVILRCIISFAAEGSW
jgi:hypothetical protein